MTWRLPCGAGGPARCGAKGGRLYARILGWGLRMLIIISASVRAGRVVDSGIKNNPVLSSGSDIEF